MIDMKNITMWLQNAVDKHNAKLTYADCEETWSVSDFIASFLFHVMFLRILFVAIGIHCHAYAVIVIAEVYAALMTGWHVWHLSYY